IWSLGCTFYELMVGRSLFQHGTKEELIQSIDQWYKFNKGEDSKLEIPEDFHLPELSQFRDLLSHMLTVDIERYSMEQVLSHPWIDQTCIKRRENETELTPLPGYLWEALKVLCRKYQLPIYAAPLGLTYDIWKRSHQIQIGRAHV